MRTRNRVQRLASLLLASLFLLLTGCGGGAEATTMRLMRTTGEVSVADGEGKSMEPRENLGLYSGYGVDTRPASFAWINLDDVKLTKMDENSEIAITKEDKHLEIEIKSGSLFFNVTEPLADDETMNIRTSSMTLGIRGTCGWVEVPDASHMNVYLLEGSVECTAGGETVTVMAGEVGRMDETAGTVTVEPFGQDTIPVFVEGELDGISLDSIPETVEPDPAADALAQYRTVLAQAETYFDDDTDYGTMEVTITYKYTLAMMQTEYQIPALVLEQETYGDYWGDFCSAKVFQYNPDSDTVVLANGTLDEGVASAGGYRGTLAMSGDGIGILETSWFSGTGMGSIRRATVAGDILQVDTIYDGFLFDDTQPSVESLPIVWYDITDLSGLDGWTPPAPAQPEPAGPEPAETALPTDGDRVVFRGTLNAYSHSEVVALQGQGDPEPDRGETYYLIVLDEPQNMTLTSGDGLSSRDGEVHLIDVTYAEGIAQYTGQHLTCSIDPNQTYWPSDVSLPLGEPRTNDVHILP